MDEHRYAVVVGDVLYPADRLEAIEHWLKVGSVSRADAAWDGAARQWSSVGALLEAFQREHSASPEHTLDPTSMVPRTVASALRRLRHAGVVPAVHDLLLIAFGYSSDEVVELGPAHDISLLAIVAGGRLRAVIGVTESEMLAGTAAETLCLVAADHHSSTAILTNATRWLTYESCGGPYEAVERIDLSKLLRPAPRQGEDRRLMKSGLLNSRIRRGVLLGSAPRAPLHRPHAVVAVAESEEHVFHERSKAASRPLRLAEAVALRRR
jgi:hypothetical protein